MSDIIRRAVELADGWGFDVAQFVYTPVEDIDLFNVDHLPQMHKDALAAQLVRQVDALAYEVISSEGHCAIYDQEGQVNVVEVNTSYDRTMNTIKAIVDSGVLE